MYIELPTVFVVLLTIVSKQCVMFLVSALSEPQIDPNLHDVPKKLTDQNPGYLSMSI